MCDYNTSRLAQWVFDRRCKALGIAPVPLETERVCVVKSVMEEVDEIMAILRQKAR